MIQQPVRVRLTGYHAGQGWLTIYEQNGEHHLKLSSVNQWSAQRQDGALFLTLFVAGGLSYMVWAAPGEDNQKAIGALKAELERQFWAGAPRG